MQGEDGRAGDADEAAFPIRLVQRPAGVEDGPKPTGLVLRLDQAAGLLARVGLRIASYPTLRLALAGDLAVVFVAEDAALPWIEEPIAWLDAEAALFLPSGFQLDAPPRWRAEIARRLLQRHGLAGPAALLPSRDPAGRPRLVNLAASRPLAEIDRAGLARLAR